MEKCIACGLCYEKCPAKISDEYNEGLSKRKAIYVPYPQAVPLKYVIDKDRCIYFKKGKCKACEKFCPTGAIKFDETEDNITLNVGSVILTAGMKAFDPSNLDNFQHSNFPNVITSLEFERILSAGGPTTGHVTRPSDGKEPKKIAWLQCVGSRDLNRCDNQYCSSVCCMYAVKEAVLAKEHVGGDFESTIFFMDMRTHGKDFEKYYERAKDEGVRFIRSRVHTITETDETGTLSLKYVTEAGETIEEKFDIAVLSVGMEPADSTVEIAQTMGVELNEHNFVKTENISPVTTTRPGIYVAGAIQGCKDIPQSVMEASAAACSAGISLASSRGTLVQEKTFPTENEVTDQTSRIGVFVCNCGTNIGGFADVPAIAEYTRGLPNVTYVEENLFTCSQDTQDKMVEVIKEHNLNRIVVAACTPRTHEPLFQETVRNAGLNPYLFEMANIRNQCTWVHSYDKKVATEKSKDLVRMATARVSILEPLTTTQVEIEHSGLVVGGGIAGMTTALELAAGGFEVSLVERESELGGNLRHVYRTASGDDPQEFLRHLIDQVKGESKIKLYLDHEVADTRGFKGKFTTRIKGPSGEKSEIKHAVTILATGGQEYRGEEYEYGSSPLILTGLEFEALLAAAEGKEPRLIEKVKTAQLALNKEIPDDVVIIHCVGPADRFCSRICCTTALKNALALKSMNPEAQITILYQDIRTYGFKENLYTRARELGIRFIRYDPDRKPEVQIGDIGIVVQTFDQTLGLPLALNPEILVLSNPIVPSDGSSQLASTCKTAVDGDGFFLEAHVKLRPVDFATEGLFMAGMAHYPKLMDETIAHAQAAASRASIILSKDTLSAGGIIAEVDASKCVGCLTCVRVCPFDVPIIDEAIEGNGDIQGAAYIEPTICQGCGICVSECPAKAIDLLHYQDDQIMIKLDALLTGV